MKHDLDPRVHRVLDGELDRSVLSADERATVERLTAATRALTGPVDGSVAHRVMAVIRRPLASPFQRFRRWLTSPQPITVSLRPVYSLVIAILLAAALWRTPAGPAPVLGAGEGVAQFVARFPEAHTVAVVGSFNDWRPEATPLSDDDHDGVWDARVILPAGQHEYMFVVDGERWVADPMAGRYVDDGFGRQNAVLLVRPHRTQQ